MSRKHLSIAVSLAASAGILIPTTMSLVSCSQQPTAPVEQPTNNTITIDNKQSYRIYDIINSHILELNKNQKNDFNESYLNSDAFKKPIIKELQGISNLDFSQFEDIHFELQVSNTNPLDVNVMMSSVFIH